MSGGVQRDTHEGMSMALASLSPDFGPRPVTIDRVEDDGEIGFCSCCHDRIKYPAARVGQTGQTGFVLICLGCAELIGKAVAP